MDNSRDKHGKYISFFILGIICVISFIIYMISLTRYSISYGPDGPYYDLRVRDILRTGVPNSNDPPLIYYYLVPFVIITGDSFLGIKIGMSIIGALHAVPAYLIVALITEKYNRTLSRVASLTSAYLVSLNVYTFRMVEDFMQNLGGTLFLLFFIYFYAKWLPDLRTNIKWGVIAVIFGVAALLTHVYPGLMAVLCAGILFIYRILKVIIIRKKVPVTELWIVGVTGGAAALLFIVAALFYPSITENIFGRLSYYISTVTSGGTEKPLPIKDLPPYITVFLNVPFIVGISGIGITALKWVHPRYRHSEEGDEDSSVIYLSAAVIVIFIIVVVLVSIPSTWIERFILLAFIPLGLAGGYAVAFIPGLIAQSASRLGRTGFKGKKITAIVASALFIVICTVNVFAVIPMMGPIITESEYNELVMIAEKTVGKSVDENGVIYAGYSYHFGYWVEYTFDMQVITGDFPKSAEGYEGRPIYAVYRIYSEPPPFIPFFRFPTCPFAPLSAPATTESGVSVPIGPITAGDPPPPLPPRGLIIFGGKYFLLTLIYYANGTAAF